MTRSRAVHAALLQMLLYASGAALAQPVITQPVSDATLPELLLNALARLPKDDAGNWAYTRETNDDLGHYVEQFDPALPYAEQWQLVSFDGQPPRAKDLRFYRKHYDELFERDSPADVDLESAIDPRTVMLIDETDDVAVYSFRPMPEDDEDANLVPYLSGRMTVSKRSGLVESMRISNIEPFSPGRLVTITEFSLSVDLAPIADQGPVFIVASTGAIMGRFMRFKKLEESEQVSYRDFEVRRHVIEQR